MPLERLGPYKIEKVLGRGGMGTVYAATHDTTGERAAVKVLAAALAEDPGFQARFKQEIDTLKKLKHPHIVQLFGFGEEDDYLFYSMELVPGHSLQDELSNGRRFTWREVTRYGVMIAKALKHAHDRGVVHRDLKPANLLLDPQEQIKLTDFGIAKLFGSTSLTMSGGVIGTADYMSPEQSEGKGVNSKSDLFSLGAVMYALLTGRPPFAAKTVTEVLHNLKNDKPIDLKHVARDAPAELAAIVMQLLEKDSAARIATALTVANRLQAMEHALSIETRVTPPANERPDLSPDENINRKVPGFRTEADAHEITADMQTAGDDVYRLTPENEPTYVPEAKNRTAGPPELTMVEPETPASSEPAISPAALRSRHFVTMAEEERSKAILTPDEDGWVRRLSLAGIVVALLGLAAIAYFASRPASEEVLRQRIEAAAKDGDVPALMKVEDSISEYLNRFGDSEAAGAMKEYQEEIELYRLERQFDLKARRLAGVDSMLPVERAYLDAMRLVPTAPEAALIKLEAIPKVFAGTERTADDPISERSITRCVELSRKQAERLRGTVSRMNADERRFLRSRIETANQIAEKDPAAARTLLQGIIELYADHPWAEDLVGQARDALARLP